MAEMTDMIVYIKNLNSNGNFRKIQRRMKNSI